MRRTTFITVSTAYTCSEAEVKASVLRRAGLHPAEVRLVAPLPMWDERPCFPVEVPSEESEAACQILSEESFAE